MRDEPVATVRRQRLAHVDTIKGVGSLRQQDRGHGSRQRLRSA
jgi:hypothetical protein